MTSGAVYRDLALIEGGESLNLRMSNNNLTAAQLRHAAELKEKIEVLQTQLDVILGGNSLPASAETPESESSKPARKKYKYSAAGLARLRVAQKARWAKIKAGKPVKLEKLGKKPRKKMSAASRAAIAAGAKARWAKAKAEKAAQAA